MSEHPHNPAAEHFKLWFYTAVLRLIAAAVQRLESWETLFERAPFLAHYNNELAHSGIAGLEAGEALARWHQLVADWERVHPGHLPIRALREAGGVDGDALTLLLLIGLADEDARFGPVFDLLQGEMGQRRPTAGLIGAWWGHGSARAQVRRLLELGLLQPGPAGGARSDSTFQVPAPIWDALSGDTAGPVTGLHFTACDALTERGALIAADDLLAAVDRLPALVAAGDCDAIVVRGARHDGRGTLLGTIARQLGRGTIEVRGPLRPDDDRWRALGPLATLLHALPVLRLDLGPGEAADVPRLAACDAPLGLVLGRHGGITGAGVRRAVALTVSRPDPSARARHWTAAAAASPLEDAAPIVDGFRLTAGNIHRAATLARSRARLAGRDAIAVGDVQQAARTLNREALDTLATRVTTPTEWRHVSVPADVRDQLFELERRCRLRERLAGAVGAALAPQLSCGVRALLSGPSGVGKSLVARALAASLQMDLYAVNMAAVVNKYVGETEKNLHELFTRAEELDVMLLLDEGDALLTSRTAVSSANDRFANLETNFLLQRIESFDGVLIITTNAAERIDSAFQRRLDMVIEFTPPEAAERLAIWDVHLPARHAVSYDLLAEVATRCALTGGQIRNAVLHAAALALEDGHTLTARHLQAAVAREYRKAGGVCPLQLEAVA